MNRIIGIGEWAVSNHIHDMIKTYALGSCVAVTVYCRKRKAAGMVHIALPAPPDSEEGEARPGYYATTGVPLLIHLMIADYGCTLQDLTICLYGGSNCIWNDNQFQIGQRNFKTIQSVLSSMNLKYDQAEVGGNVSRTVTLNVADGNIKVKANPFYSD
jgi:chemotaxis protein CheD